MPITSYITRAARYSLWILLALAISARSFAQDQPFPKTHLFVNDWANVLTADDVQRLGDLCRSFQSAHGYQLVIVTLTSLNGEDINHAATRFLNEQGVGRKGADTGVVIMLAMQERKAYIGTGKGTEAALTDARAASICRNTMRPVLREGRTGDALYAGAQDVVNVIEGRGESNPMPVDEPGGGRHSPPIGLFVFGLGAFGVVTAIAVRSTLKCPRCGHWMSVSNEIIQPPGLLSNGYGMRTRTCSSCGFSDQTRYTIYRNSGGGFGGGIGGGGGWSSGDSGGGGWSGGGGFSGGGGESGGGGGGSSW